ncbi:MAG: hypothetical protein QXK32_04775 [Candidatus Jordarchaeales archaeon]
MSYFEEFHRLPSKVGKDIIDLERYAKLPRENTYNCIESFLEAARKSEEVKVLFIVAEWGEGKTSIYEGLFKKPEVIKSDLVIPIPTRNVITFIKEHYKEFSDTTSSGLRLFACLLHVIKDSIENNIIQLPVNLHIPSKQENQKTRDFILKGLDAIFNVIDNNSRFFIFFDEFEDIVDESRDIIDSFVGGIIDIINGQPSELAERSKYGGRLHLIIAVTPPAFQTFKSRTRLTQGAKLFGQRAEEVYLEKLTREHAYNYISGILNFCWDGQLPRIPLYKTGMLNTIYLASLGNPRIMLNITEKLLTYAKISAGREGYTNKIKLITPNLFISAISELKVQIHGGEATILDSKILSSLYEKIDELGRSQIDKEKCKKLFHLLLSTIAPISEKEIQQELNLTDKGQLSQYLLDIKKVFNEKWGIREPFLVFKKVEEQDKIYQKIESGNINEEEKKLLSDFIKIFEFYEYTGNVLSKTIFLPQKRLSDMEFESPLTYKGFIEFIINNNFNYDENNIKNCDNIIRKDDIELSDEKYYMLAPSVFGMFYPLPSSVALDFIENMDQRFKVGKDLLFNLVGYKDLFHEGILKLLKDGCEKISIERKREKYGYQEIYFIEILYRETLQEQNYKVRAYILPMLDVVEHDFERKIDTIIENIMKEGYIPLLLVFSWHPLPIKIESILRNKFQESILFYKTFALSTNNCQKIIGYAISNNEKYKIINERWKEKAKKIIDELKFEKFIEEFIKEGGKKGYVLRTPSLKKLSLGKRDDIPSVLRTLLVTSGSIKERFDQIKELERTFKIYGSRTFPVSPKDIESEKALSEFVDDLVSLKLVEKKEGEEIKVVKSPIEKRIIEILKNYGKMQKEQIEKLFVTFDAKDLLDTYLRTLLERREIVENNGFYSLNRVRPEDRLEKLKNKFEELKENFGRFANFGYLCSIKKREENVILVKDCMDKIEEIIRHTESMIIQNLREEVSRNLLLLELLIDQLSEIYKILDELLNKLKIDNVKNELHSMKKKLEELENKLNKERSRNMRCIKINEKVEIEEKIEKLKKIEEKSYTKDEINKTLREMIKSKSIEDEFRKHSDLFKQMASASCYVFDLKAVELNKLISDIKNLLPKMTEKWKNIEDLLGRKSRLKREVHESETKLSQQIYQDGLFSSLLSELLLNRRLCLSDETEAAVNETTEDFLNVDMPFIINALEKDVEELNKRYNELKSFLSELEKLYNNEKELFKKINEIQAFQRSLELFLEGCKDLSHISKKLEELRNKMESRVDSLRREFLNENVQLSSCFKKVKEELNGTRDECSSIETELQNILNEIKNDFNNQFSQLESLLGSIKRDVNTVDLQRELNELKNDFQSCLKEIQRCSTDDSIRGFYEKLLQRISRFRNKLRETGRKFLSENEFLILEALYETEFRKAEGLEFGEAINLLKKNNRLVGVSEDLIQSSLVSLSRRRYITLKIFL